MATDRIIEHVNRLREKPHHVRHNIAMGVAFGITGLVALGWMTALATSGTLALESNSPEERAADAKLSETVAESTNSFSNLMGAAGAAFSMASSSPELDIVEGEARTRSTLDTNTKPANDTDKTVISF